MNKDFKVGDYVQFKDITGSLFRIGKIINVDPGVSKVYGQPYSRACLHIDKPRSYLIEVMFDDANAGITYWRSLDDMEIASEEKILFLLLQNGA